MFRTRLFPGLLVLGASLAMGCTGSRAPILGLPSATTPFLGPMTATPPTVTAVAPVNNATGVPINNTLITVAFSEPMAPITGGAVFTLTAPAPAGAPAGAVTLDAGSTIATFTLASGTTLASGALYTATISGATSIATGLALANPYVWQFRTGSAPNLTRPRVALTVPATTLPGPTPAVPTNTAITAVFTADMNPASITAASFQVTAPGAMPAGAVSYVVGSRTAVFTPSAALAPATTYTATITTLATDLVGNALAGNQGALPGASNYVWTFTTASAPDVVLPVITFTAPAQHATLVALNSAVNATFSKAMNPQTLTTATFMVQVDSTPRGAPLAGAVFYNPANQVATFTPAANFVSGQTYLATVAGAKDLSGNALTAGPVPNPWSFTTGPGLSQTPIALGTAATFALMATTTITNTGSSVVNGNVSLDPGSILTGSPLVNGTVDLSNAVSVQAFADLSGSYNAALALSAGTTVAPGADLGALSPAGLTPGTYTCAGTLKVATPLILDAGGNGNAVWIFQVGGSLASTAAMTLANGAQAKNVFWATVAGAQLGTGTFLGTLMTQGSITVAQGATVNGRLLSGANASSTSVALLDDTINVPAQ